MPGLWLERVGGLRWKISLESGASRWAAILFQKVRNPNRTQVLKVGVNRKNELSFIIFPESNFSPTGIGENNDQGGSFEYA